MKIALLADIHGNTVALDAVLADITKQGGVDAYWLLGDLVALGPDPIGVLRRLTTLPGLKMVRGNTDRYTTSADRPGPALEAAREDANLLPSLVEVANTFAWTQGMITAEGWFRWVKGLPLEFTTTLPDGTRFLGVHASPGTDDGSGIQSEMADEQIASLFGSRNDFDLVVMGHTHLPLDKKWNGIHLVNPGAVSLSRTPGGHACYAILDAPEAGYRVIHRQVSYDHQVVIDQLNELLHPARGFLIGQLSQ